MPAALCQGRVHVSLLQRLVRQCLSTGCLLLLVVMMLRLKSFCNVRCVFMIKRMWTCNGDQIVFLLLHVRVMIW